MICGQDDVVVYKFLALSGSKKVELTLQHFETTVLLLSYVCDIQQFDEQELFVLHDMYSMTAW